VRADLGPRRGREALMAWQVGRRSCGAKARLGVMSSEEPQRNQARQSCRELRGCAGHVSVAHVHEQRKFNREQEDLEVRGGVGLANQFGSIISSHDPRHPATSTRHHHRALLITNPVHRGNSLSAYSSPQPRLPQGLP
jgi:hypothetical protein